MIQKMMTWVALILLLIAGRSACAATFMYAESFSTGTIYAVDQNGAYTPWLTGLNGPAGMAMDPVGNLYVSIRGQPGGGSTVIKITPDKVVTNFATGLNSPVGLAFDPQGVNLYAANYDGNSIVKIAPNGAVTPFAAGIDGPAVLAFDKDGNLYASRFTHGNFSTQPVLKITPGGSVSTFATTPGLPSGLAFDTAGNLFVGTRINAGTAEIDKILPNGTISTFATGLVNPQGLSFDQNGFLYASDYTTGKIWKVDSTGNKTVFMNNLPGASYFVMAPVPVPVPAAVWTGLSTFGAAALVRVARKRFAAR